ncbi:MAG: hypothetical protein ACREKL_06245 [Chthoniobacterales bacterium]
MLKRPKWPWITLLVLEAAQLLSLVPWVVIAGFSFMAFDAPGSVEKSEPWTLVKIIWSYPLWLLAAGILSWTLFAFRRYVTAVVISTIFTIPMTALMVILLIVSRH